MKISQQASFEKAGNAFELARRASSKLEKCRHANALSRLGLWREFLINWRICCNCLTRAGCSGEPKQFIDRMKIDIQEDDTLQLILQSRNEDAHGVEIAQLVASEFRYESIGNNKFFALVKGDAAGIWFEGNTTQSESGVVSILPTVLASVEDGRPRSENSLPKNVEFSPALLELKNLTSRTGEYPVPMLHIESEQRPYAIATYGLKFLERQFDLPEEYFE